MAYVSKKQLSHRHFKDGLWLLVFAIIVPLGSLFAVIPGNEDRVFIAIGIITPIFGAYKIIRGYGERFIIWIPVTIVSAFVYILLLYKYLPMTNLFSRVVVEMKDKWEEKTKKDKGKTRTGTFHKENPDFP